MHRAPRIPHAHAIALTRSDPVLVPWRAWTTAAIVLAVLLAGLLGR
ncbi:hypothetical protein [Anaeromyxobacter oryzisoli]|nr:hypothetical protein [Anaeromyxobacter sp. SG63]